MNRPRLLIAGTRSGVGKSSLSLAIVAALVRQGMKVQTYKVGPDFLDPSHLAALSGRPCYNLDGWMAGEEHVRQLFARTSVDADISIIEGVMGLFDGSSADDLSGSSAEIAAWLKAPVLLVVNAHGMARSIAPLALGFCSFDPQVRVAGLIANQCGSTGHGRWLAEALAAAGLPPLLGAVPRGALPDLQRRHLGLVSAEESAMTGEQVEMLALAAQELLNLPQLLQLAEAACPLSGAPAPPQLPQTGGRPVRIGVARDAAFSFYYQDLLDLLPSLGAKIVPFSPLRDTALPPGLDGLYLGGGYPELHAATLSANRLFMESLRRFAATDRPLYAECGGLIYLSQGLEQPDGGCTPLAGLLPVAARMLPQRKALCYLEVTLQQPSLFGPVGTRLRGHEFHYSELCASPLGLDGWQAAYSLRRNRSNEVLEEGYQRGSLLASYAHLQAAAVPGAVAHFVETCRRSHEACY